MFDLDDEKTLIRDTARAFANEVVRPQAAAIDADDAFPFDIYRQMGELGFLSMTLPEEHGGSGADTLSWTLVQEELARASASVADAHMVNKLMCDIILSDASDAVRKAYLPRMARGEAICAIAQTEADTGSDVASIRTVARPVEGGYSLSGSKQFITFAGICDLAIVVATTDRSLGKAGIGLFLVDATSKGFIRGAKNPVMGVRGLATGELSFDEVFVPADHLLAAPGTGMRRSLTSLNSGRVGMAAQSVGIAQAAFDDALLYSKTRHAFGKPIADLQAIQFMLADMSVQIEAARLMTRRAAHVRDKGGNVVREVSEAKLFASEIASRVVDDALQIHGAYGYSRETVIERLYRDIRVYRIWEGTSQIQRVVIARQLLAT